MTAIWLAFSPRPKSRRIDDGRGTVGAHAFSIDLPRSLCSLVSREQAGDPVGDEVTRCTTCLRAIARIEARILEQTRHDVAASVARHADLDDLTDAERRIAERIGDLPEIDPAPGWEARLVDRARRGRR